MKQKKTVLVLLLAFVLLLGGAYRLYTRLEGSVNTYQLSAQETDKYSRKSSWNMPVLFR